MRRKVSMILVSLVLLACVSCAGLKAKWDGATEDEKARIVISQAQESLKTMFISGQALAATNEKFRVEWKAKILPAIDVSNKLVGDFIARGARGEQFTWVQVTGVLGGRLKEIMDLLGTWGVKVSKVEGTLMTWGVLKLPS